MGNDLLMWKYVLWGAPMIGIIIGFIANHKIEKINSRIAQEKEKIEISKNETRDKKLEQSLLVSLNKNDGDTTKDKFKNSKKSIKNSTNMENKNKSGDNYNVTSNNQSGGITAGKVDLHFDKKEDADEIAIDLNDNYTVSYDNSSNRFTCQPKVGKWEKPLIAISFEEKDLYKKFGANTNQLPDKGDGFITNISNVKIYGGVCGTNSPDAKPATNSMFYYLELNSKPTFIIFGNYGKALYKYNVPKGTVSRFF